MIKQMERRFTIVAISVIGLVLLVLIIVVNAISVSGNIQRADNSLDRLAETSFDDRRELDSPEDQVNIKPPKVEDSEGMADSSELFNAEFNANRDTGKEENRSFEVILDNHQNLIWTTASLKNMQDDDISYQMAMLAVEDNHEYGFVEDFRYLKIDNDTQTKIIFLDYSFERQAEHNFIGVSIVAYFAAIIFVTILVRVLMKPVMKSIKESYAKQKQFITDASHELKTPLTVISTDMELIAMENGSSEWIISVNNQVKKLNTLTNELVSLSRMNEEQIHIEMGEVNLSDMINDVAMGFEPAIVARGKGFEVNVEEDISVKGHYDSLERVMSILLENALKYSDEQGVIRIDLSKKGKKVSLSVMNSVAQIHKGNHEEFFQRFYRSDASRNSQTGGFGIGLAIVKSTVEEHQGKIEVFSNDEKSIEVLITLKA